MLIDSAASMAMIEKFIAFDTISHKSNLEMIQFIGSYLDQYKVPYFLSYDATGQKANLFATIGPQDKPGIMLAGHIDVVPVDNQKWDSDPFKVVVKDGRIIGRGTTDMKAYLAVVLAQVPQLVKMPLKTPIHLAFTYDEEVGCLGVKVLLEDLERRGIKPAMCILGEPTEMGIVTGHKGKMNVIARVTGSPGHSSMPDAYVNALHYAAEIVVFLKNLNAHNRQHGPFNHDFDPPYSTVHVGIFHAGTVLNIVPNLAEFVFEFRCIPGHNPDDLFNQVRDYANTQLLPDMRKVFAGSAIELTVESNTAPMETPEDAPVVQLVKQITGLNHCGRFSGGTEGGDFNHHGIPTAIVGPGIGPQCHVANEYVTVEHIQKLESFLAKLFAQAQQGIQT